MKKTTRDTAIFFTILYWFLFYVLIVKKKMIFPQLNGKAWIWIIGGYVVLMALSRFLFPVYSLILKGSAYLGKFIFAVVTALVFFLILTPISLFKKMGKQRLIVDRFEPAAKTYYEKWQPSTDISKQY